MHSKILCAYSSGTLPDKDELQASKPDELCCELQRQYHFAFSLLPFAFRLRRLSFVFRLSPFV